MSDMRKILKSFDAIQKKTLNEAFVVECPPDMPTMETGGDLSINITGDAASMSQILRALAGIQGGRMSMGTAMQDDPRIPGRDDVEGDQDLNQGIIGTTLGGALGAGLGLATGAGPMGTTLGALSGAAAGDSLTDRDEDDPRIPGRDDVEGDTDLQAGVLGNIGTTAGQTVKHGAVGAGLGAALGGAAGMALGGPAGAIQGAKLGGLGGAALGGAAGRGAATAKMTKQELQAGSKDNPRIPGRDDVEGDMDLQQDIGALATGALDALKGFGAQAGDAIASGALSAGDAAASTGLGQRAIDAMGQASDWAAGKGAEYGSRIGQALGGAIGGAKDGVIGAGVGAGLGGLKGSEIGATVGKVAPAAAATGAGLAVGSKALGGTGDKKARNRPAENSPSEEYMSSKEMMAGGNDIHAPKHPKDIRIKDASAYDKDAVEEWENEPSEEYSDHDMMLNKLSGGINGKKKMYKAAQRGDNAMAVEAANISPTYIQHLKLKYGDKPSLSPREQREVVKNILDRLNFRNIETLMSANIPHVSQMAKIYLRNKTPGGMVKYSEATLEMKSRLEAKLAEKKNAKPDFLDMDKDGNKKEPMKKAIDDKKKKGPVKETSKELTDIKKILSRLL